LLLTSAILTGVSAVLTSKNYVTSAKIEITYQLKEDMLVFFFSL
jgi:hypothetical protein